MAAIRKGSRKEQLPGLEEEALLWNHGNAFVFGVDEAGRGCLAGPVCAAVACWAPFSLLPGASALPVPVRDSKQMTEPQREACFDPVKQRALASGVGFASAAEIDRWNILRATHLAALRALESALQSIRARGLSLDFSRVAFLADGGQPLISKGRFFVGAAEYAPEFPLTGELFRRSFTEKCVVKGDGKVFSIASASVLAKVSRDRRMLDLAEKYPAYEFAVHKGYPTPQHVGNLNKAGPSPEHRRSFSPVAEACRALGME
jgi:ribonuclease HII